MGLWEGVRSFLGIGSFGDWVFKQVCQVSALVVILMVALIVVLLAIQAWPALQTVGITLITSSDWNPSYNPNSDDPDAVAVGRFGGLAFVYGSVMTSFIAMLLAVPLGVGTATFLAEIAPPWLKRAGSFLVELLAAIPSVVYGFWGINFLAPAVQGLFDRVGGPNIGGKGILSASLVLAVMVVPYLTAVAYDVCQAVPRSQREGSLALGATRWQTIWKVVLPYARPGIIGGCFLSLGRAIGETMAVTMLIGNTPVIEGLFGRGNTIPSVLALELPATSSPQHESALIALGLLLFGVTIVMNVAARVLIWRVDRVGGRTRLEPRVIAPRVEPAPLADAELEQSGPSRLDHDRIRADSRTPSNSIQAGFINHVMTGVLGLCLVITCVPLFLIFGYITYRGVDALSWDFFTQLPRPLGETGGGLANALVGSFLIVGLASAAAIPVGLLAAIFLAEYRTSRVAPVVRFFGELLNGVPSIVIGTFVYAFVRLFIQMGALRPREQFSGWAGAFALFIMMVPIVMRASEEALKLVPQALRNASHALGAHHWQTVLRVSVPAALPAIITGAFLAIARIAGETAPLLLTAFGNERITLNPAEKMAFLPLYIYRYSMSGDAEWEKQAWAGALVLLAFIMLLNVGIRFLTGRRVVLASRAD
jgi:phosphate transport system permease protein